MKKQSIMKVLGGVALVTALHAPAAGARSIEFDRYEARIVDVELHPAHGDSPEAVGGFVQVDYGRGTVSLTVFQGDHCPSGRACRALVVAPLRFELPIVGTGEDTCGTTVIIARKDQRPADGVLAEIRIRDHRTRRCRDLPPFATEIQYTTVTPGWEAPATRSISRFGAEKLVPTLSRW
ncbi:MAG: hypothetical protein NDJ89_13740 [Oligoflexia bacterium]|nr:hypothetical protein [Oligoflexia bacterium]